MPVAARETKSNRHLTGVNNDTTSHTAVRKIESDAAATRRLHHARCSQLFVASGLQRDACYETSPIIR